MTASFDGGVALISPSGWGNLGDAAIVDSAIHAVRRRMPRAPILALTLNPADTARRHAVPAFTCSGFSRGDYGLTDSAPSAWPSAPGAEPFAAEAPRPIAEAPGHAGSSALAQWLRRTARLIPGASRAAPPLRMVASDLRHRRLLHGITADLRYIVVAGGGQLDDYWGGPLGHPYVLWRWAARARATGARFVVLSVGTGTLSTRLSARLVRRALASADYRSFRDEGSRRLVGDRLVEHDPIVPDLAYAFPVPASRPRDARADGRRPVVAMSPFAHCDPRVGPVRDPARYGAYIERLALLARRLLETGHSLLLYSTNKADNPPLDDLRAAMFRLVAPELLHHVTTPVVTTVAELFAALSTADVALASRLHGVLLAHLAGLPASALSYERKVRVLMRTANCERYCVEIDEFQPEPVLERVRELVTRRDEVRAGIARQVDEFRRHVEEQYDFVFGRTRRAP